MTARELAALLFLFAVVPAVAVWFFAGLIGAVGR